MSTAEGVGSHEEARPPLPPDETARRGQERPIGGGEAGSCASTAEDLQLMAQHENLEISLLDAKPHEEAEQRAQEPVEHG